MPLEEFTACFLITMVAATIHGSAGIGFALIAAPLLALIDTSLVPGPLIAAGLVLTVLMAIRERRDADLSGVGWALTGCLVGAVVAIPVIRMLSPTGFAILFSTLLLLAVVLSGAGFHLSPSPRVNMSGGLASGFMGTISSVGGPPIALVYQGASGPRLRATLAVYFTFAGMLSVSALYVAGHMGTDEVTLASYLAPGLILGYLVSSYTKKFLDRRTLRPIVLVFATAAAIGVVVKALI